MAAPRPLTRGTVYLLHGLNRTQLSMALLARRIARAGYRTRNLHYPSRDLSLEEHADRLLAVLGRDVAAGESGAGAPAPVHFVTHSLGGLVVRCALQRCDEGRPPRSRPGRAVLIAPPNHGSELAARLVRWPLSRLHFGTRCFRQLAGDGLAQAFGPPPIPLGVIAGGRGDGRGWNPLLPGDDDLVVTVAGTHLPGEADHIVLRSAHTTLPWRRETARQALHFLEHGRFARMPLAAPEPA